MSQLDPVKELPESLYKEYEFNGVETGTPYKVKCRTRYALKRAIEVQSELTKIVQSSVSQEDIDKNIANRRAMLADAQQGYSKLLSEAKDESTRRYFAEEVGSCMEKLAGLNHIDKTKAYNYASVDMAESPEVAKKLAALLFDTMCGVSIEEIFDKYDFPTEIFVEGKGFFSKSTEKLNEQS